MRPAHLAIVATLAVATVAFGTFEKHVTVQVEGRPIAVSTYAATIGEALQRAGIEVGPQDRVIPPEDAALRDGSTVQVRRAKPVTVLLNGKPKRVIVTALTIEEVLAEINVRDKLVDAVFPARDARVEAGMTITYRQAVAVTVAHDGEQERVITNATSVGAVVRELGITLRARDRVEPAAGSVPVQGMSIRVLRVGLRKETRTVEVGYSTILRRTTNLEYGSRRLGRAGTPGIKRVRYLARYEDDKRVSRRVIGVSWVRRPQAKIILIGAGFPGCRCGAGVQLGKATWYGQADGLTAAHRTLPMGTVVRVENTANGAYVNVVIRDRGPYGDGRIIDLSDEAFSRIASLGAGVINVRIRW